MAKLLEGTNPLTGGKIDIASPKVWLGLIAGTTVLALVMKFSQGIADNLFGKVPANVRGLATKPSPNTDPYGGKIVY